CSGAGMRDDASRHTEEGDDEKRHRHDPRPQAKSYPEERAEKEIEVYEDAQGAQFRPKGEVHHDCERSEGESIFNDFACAPSAFRDTKPGSDGGGEEHDAHDVSRPCAAPYREERILEHSEEPFHRRYDGRSEYR